MRDRAGGHVPLRRLLDRGTIDALFGIALRAEPAGTLALVDAHGALAAGDLGSRHPEPARVALALDAQSTDDRVEVDDDLWLRPLRIDGVAIGGLLVGGPIEGPIGDTLLGCLAAMLAQAVEIRILGQETLDRYREINLLYRVGETIGASLDATAIPGLLLSEASRAIRSDAACVLIGIHRRVAATTGTTELVEAAIDASRELVDEVVVEGRPVLVSPGPRAPSIGSLLVVPIRAQDERIGAIVLARRQGGAALTASDEKLLLAVAGEAGVAYDRARLHEQELGRQRLDEELAVGRRIQLSLLPSSTPTTPGWGFAAVYQASREVGGDFYDFLTPGGAQGSLDLVIGDVTGKGVPAALMMAATRAVVRASAEVASTPSDVLRRTNHHLIHDRRAGLFVTALYASLDLERGDVVVANGGHDAPLWVHGASRRTQLITSGSAILGMFRDPVIEDRRLHLERGDVLVLYTDGVTEARDPRRRLFGDRRLRAVVSANASGGATSIAEAIMAAVRDFCEGIPMADDLTLVVVKRLDG